MHPRNKGSQVAYWFVVLSLLAFAGTAWAQSGTISSTNFGMQCGIGKSTNCPNFTLPNHPAKPGLFRLWDSSTYWAVLQPKTFTGCSDIQQISGVNTYCWDNLDSWLDAIAADSAIKDVIYTFGG